MLKKRFVWSVVALFAMALVWTACDSGSTSSISGTQEFSGPGSHYVATLGDGDFSIVVSESVNSDNSITVTGTYEEFDTGFLRLTVGAVTPESDDGPSVGDQALGIAIDGFALIIKPLDGDEIIPMLIAGDCPTDDFSANWLIAQNTGENSAASTDSEWFGTFAYNNSEQSASIPTDHNLVDFNSTEGQGSQLTIESCSNGFIQISENGELQANMWLTSNGGAIVETFEADENDPDRQVRNTSIFGVPQSTVEQGDLEGTWAGVALQGSADDDDEKVFPVSVTLNSEGVGTGVALTNVETGATDEDSVTITLDSINSPSTGFVNGTIASGSESGNLACSSAKEVGNDSDNILICTGQDPGDNTKQFALALKKIN